MAGSISKYIQAAERHARDRLSEKRLAHTLRVAQTAEQLAKLHGIDPDKARLAGLLHDITREEKPEELLGLARQWNIKIEGLDRERPKLLHGPVAAEYSRQEFEIEDEEVISAVRVHTTGEEKMSPLALVIFIADKIEPARDYPGIYRPRDLAEKDLNQAARVILQETVSYNKSKGSKVHPRSLGALKWLENTCGD